MSGSNTTKSVESQQYLQKDVLQGPYGLSAVLITFSKVVLTSQVSRLTMNFKPFCERCFLYLTVHGSLFEIKNVTSFSFNTIL